MCKSPRAACAASRVCFREFVLQPARSRRRKISAAAMLVAVAIATATAALPSTRVLTFGDSLTAGLVRRELPYVPYSRVMEQRLGVQAVSSGVVVRA